VRTGAQPAPHATAEHAAGDLDLVERYGAMAGAIGWTRGALSQAGRLDRLASLPSEQRTTLPDGTTVLGIHASPRSDDGPGIDTDATDRELHGLLADAGADVVIGGHTHIATDRTVGGVRALNPGSVGMPKRLDGAAWMLVDATEAGVAVEHRRVAYDVDAVVTDLHRRGYPSAAWVESMLRRTHPFAR
jgi:Calcineurin-like phosphoesterase superfamily domain